MIIVVFRAAGRKAELHQLLLVDGLNGTTPRTRYEFHVSQNGTIISQRLRPQGFKQVSFMLTRQDSRHGHPKDPPRRLSNVVAKRPEVVPKRQMRTGLQDLPQTLRTGRRHSWSHNKTKTLRGRP